MTSFRLHIPVVVGIAILFALIFFSFCEKSPVTTVLESTDTPVELTLNDRTITLLNLVEVSPSRAVPALKNNIRELPIPLLNIVLKTCLLRSLGKDDSLYLPIVSPYRDKCFPLFEELKAENADLIQLLRLYGDVYVNKSQGGWTTQVSPKEKEFLFSFLLYGLKDSNLPDEVAEERYRIRACALGLVGLVTDSSSSSYLREMIRSETWKDNIATAKETLRKL